MMEALHRKRELNKDMQNKMLYVAFMITMFARSYKMNRQKAYLYLEKYGGLDFLNEHWWALHTDNPFWVVRDMFTVCRNNGGLR